MHFSVSVCVCVRVCMRRWCSCQLEKDRGKGAIGTQLALITSTLLWWAAALCEMTKCCVPRLVLWLLHRCWCSRAGGCSQREREQASQTVNTSTVVIMFFLSSFCWSLPNVVVLSLLWLLLNICLSQYPCLSVSLLMCLLFHLSLLQQVYFFPHCLFHLLWLNCFQGSVWWMLFPFLPF